MNGNALLMWATLQSFIIARKGDVLFRTIKANASPLACHKARGLVFVAQ